MRTGTVSYRLEDLKNGVIIPIGFVGENDFTKVFFDAEEIYKKYPSASVSMKVQPPKGGIYPATVTRDGNTVIWQVKEADVAHRGGGELQLTFTDGETKIKTYIAKTDVKRSLAGNGPAPDPVQGWIDDAEEVLDDLEAMDTIAKNAQAGDIGKALSPKTVEDGVVTEWQYIETGGGTEDYSDLENKPSIGGVTLAGDKSLHDLGIAAESAIPDVSGKANLSVVAPAFDQATENDAGSLVTYTDGVVYVLPEGHTAGTTWANTQKTSTNIAEQQRLLKNAIQGLEDDKYEKPSGGIPSTDMTSSVQESLSKADTALQGDDVASAVDDWLEDHPEATTTVQDGSITYPKLNSSLADASIIVETTDESYIHDGLFIPLNITFEGNSKAFRTAKYANRKNLMPQMSGSGTAGSVPWTSSGLYVEMNGQAGTLSGDYVTFQAYNNELSEKLPAGSYVFKFFVNLGDTVWNKTGKADLYCQYTGESSWTKLFSEYLTSSDKSISFTAANEIKTLRMRIPVGSGTYYSGYKLWCGLYASDVTIVDTNETVPNGEEYTYTIASPTVNSIIDTMMHQSVAQSIIKTKDYVDALDVDINDKLTYVTPEKFGAVGDGVTDDTQALKDCIAYAITNGKAVRGFNKYKTSDTITINNNNGLDVFIQKIDCSDDDAAVIISGVGIKFSFDTIISQAKGIKFSNINGACYRHVINGINLDSTNDSIWIGTGCYYTTVTIRRVSSTNGNCITFPTTDPVSNEFVFNDFTCACPTGWVAYYPSDSKFYNFTVEGNCYYGVYDPAGCSFVNWRVTEQCDKYDRYIHGEQGYVGGPLFKFVNARRAARNKYYSNDNIKFFSLNVDDLVTRNEYDNVTQWIQENWQGCVFDANAIGSTVGGATFLMPVGKMMIFGGKRIIIPTYNLLAHIKSASWDLRWLDDETHLSSTGYGSLRLATHFIADLDADLYLSASYNAIAYKHFELDTDGNDVSVYDWTGTKIFDSTEHTGTKFAFDCVANPENMGRYGRTSSFWSYDGTNHTWTVTELN